MVPRLLALIAAVAMVAGSLALRSRLDEGGAGRGGGGRALPRLVCSTELEAACRELAGEGGRAAAEVTVEPAGVTADRLVAVDGDPGLDGWLVAGPYPEMVEERRRVASRDPLFAPAGGPVARSPLVIVMWPERAAAMAKSCGRPVDWRCLGDSAPKRWSDIGGDPAWGPVRPGYADPSVQAVGLSVIAAAVSDFFGGPTNFDRNELNDNDAFRGWFAGLSRAVRRRGQTPPLQTMLTFKRAELEIVATVEAEAGPAIHGVTADKPVVLYPEPVVTADVVLGVRPGKGGASAASLVERRAAPALARSGWRVAGQPPAPGVSPDTRLPPTNGLPPPGVLGALREVHQELTR